MNEQSLLITIVNHQCNQNAIALKQGFSRLAETLLIDSGSELGEQEKEAFDQLNENIYYSGLFNQAVAALLKSDKKWLLFVASDVKVSNYGIFLQRLLCAMENRNIGVYAPNSSGSNHRQMWCKHSGSMRPVPFVEGYCFAARRDLLEKIYPVDVAINRMGWGIDVYLGYHAFHQGLLSVVDDRVKVEHPIESGYCSDTARKQRDQWLQTLPQKAQRFQRLSGWVFFKTRIGFWLFRLLVPG